MGYVLAWSVHGIGCNPLQPAGAQTMTQYHVYRFRDNDSAWARIESSGPTSYNDAKAIERDYQASGEIVRLFDTSFPAVVLYSADNG
jgi:hypothetical protein